MSAHALVLLAHDLDAQPAGLTSATCAILADRLRSYACAWHRETRALDEIVVNAQEDADAAEDAETPLCLPVRLSAELMAVRRDVQGQLDRVIAGQQAEVRARRGEAG